MSESMYRAARMTQELPWLVNGSLPESGLDAQALRQALADDPALRSERVFLERLRTSLQQDEGALPGELGWRRLQQKLDPNSSESATTNTWGRPAANSRWWRPLAIAASVLVAVQTVWLLNPTSEDGSYVPMSAPPGASVPAAPAEATVLQVQPSPQATLLEWQAVLQEIGAQVVSGPSASGVYRIAVPQAQAEQAQRTLEQAQGLINHVAAE